MEAVGMVKLDLIFKIGTEIIRVLILNTNILLFHNIYIHLLIFSTVTYVIMNTYS